MLPTHAAESMLRLLELDGLAEEVFETPDEAAAWLRRPHPMLDGESPLECAKSGFGADSAEDLARRAKLELHEMKLLAAADALMSLSGHRRQQVWDAAALRSTPELLRDAPRSTRTFLSCRRRRRVKRSCSTTRRSDSRSGRIR